MSTYDETQSIYFPRHPFRHPVVRVYVSSTYTDMMLEKNVLVTEVYPRLKELCRERYGLEFQVRFKSCSY